MDYNYYIGRLVSVANVLNNVEVKGVQNLSNLYRSIGLIEEIVDRVTKERDAEKNIDK